jgi:hypothetical protein
MGIPLISFSLYLNHEGTMKMTLWPRRARFSARLIDAVTTPLTVGKNISSIIAMVRVTSLNI